MARTQSAAQRRGDKPGEKRPPRPTQSAAQRRGGIPMTPGLHLKEPCDGCDEEKGRATKRRHEDIGGEE